jgi:hypothetical protein
VIVVRFNEALLPSSVVATVVLTVSVRSRTDCGSVALDDGLSVSFLPATIWAVDRHAVRRT